MNSDDQDLYDDQTYDLVMASIPDEMVELEHTKYGSVKLHRRGIFNMATRGASVRDISQIFGVTEKTLYTHVGREMKAGKAFIGPRLKANLLRQAMSPEKTNATLLIFALKNWTELTEEGHNSVDELDGKPEWKIEPPKFEHKTTLTESEREELEGDDDE